MEKVGKSAIKSICNQIAFNKAILDNKLMN